MAEKQESRRSKIPRYLRTTTPILSSSYRRALQDIKTKRAEIEMKQRKIDSMKKTLTGFTQEEQTTSCSTASTTRSTRLIYYLFYSVNSI